MRILASLILCGILVQAQSPETGRIDREGDESTLIVDSPRPLDSAALTLARQFGILVSAEDPRYEYAGDIKDVTAEVSRFPNPTKRVLVPKGGRLAVRFPVTADGAPQDVRGLLQSLVDTANAQFPFSFRLDADGDAFAFVPTRSRDTQGHAIEVEPLLDRRVTIALATRSIAETANLMAAGLSAQTGLRVSCCQGVVAGIPWGLKQIPFEAHDEPARSVLKRLIASEGGAYFWLERCDPLPSTWCFINLNGL